MTDESVIPAEAEILKGYIIFQVRVVLSAPPRKRFGFLALCSKFTSNKTWRINKENTLFLSPFVAKKWVSKNLGLV